MKDSWLASLQSDQLRFLSQVANIIEANFGEAHSLNSASDDIREEIDRRKLLVKHPFVGDLDNTLVKEWVTAKIKKYRNSLNSL